MRVRWSPRPLSHARLARSLPIGRIRSSMPHRRAKKPDTYACSPLAPTIHSPRRQTPGRRRTPPRIPSRSPATSSTPFPSATEPVPDIRLSAYTTGAHPGETASVTVPEFVTNGSRVRNDHHESHRCDPPANNGRGDRDPRARPSPRSHPQIAKNTTPHLCTGPSPTTTHPGLGARPARPTGPSGTENS